MNQKIIFFIILVTAIFMVPVMTIQNKPNMPTVATVSAADDGDTSWGGGSECEGYSGPPCTNPQVTTRCYPYSTYPSPACPTPGQFCEVECDQGSTGMICQPIPSPSTATTTSTPDSPSISTLPNCGGVFVGWLGLGIDFQYAECGASISGYKIYRKELPNGQYILVHTMGPGTGWTDSDVVIGKSYQYKVEAVLINTGSTCNPPIPSRESGSNLIPPCPSVGPAASTVRPSTTTPTSSTAPAASTAPAQRGRYVCRTITSPNTNGGSQLQLQTLKCEYVN